MTLCLSDDVQYHFLLGLKINRLLQVLFVGWVMTVGFTACKKSEVTAIDAMNIIAKDAAIAQ